jgi:hypothetical protein
MKTLFTTHLENTVECCPRISVVTLLRESDVSLLNLHDREGSLIKFDFLSQLIECQLVRR